MFTIPIIEITAIFVSGYAVSNLIKDERLVCMTIIGTVCMMFYIVKLATDPDDKDPDGDI